MSDQIAQCKEKLDTGHWSQLTNRFWFDVKVNFWQLSSKLFEFSFEIHKPNSLWTHKLSEKTKHLTVI